MRIVGNAPSGGKKPTTPTIGTATDGGTGTTVSVAFTPSTYIGKGTITYTATSSPGSLTGTGSGSPITVSGLTTGTAYTFTVKGDTNYGVASDSSAASNSVTPASPSSFESIATLTPSGGQTSVSFTSIPSTYKSLQIRVWGRDTSTSTYATLWAGIQFNGDTASNYSRHAIFGNGVNSLVQAMATGPYFRFNCVSNSQSGATTIGGVGIMDIIDYASTSKTKVTRSIGGSENNTGSNSQIWLESGLWNSTAAINRIDLIMNLSGTAWASGTTIALYGIK